MSKGQQTSAGSNDHEAIADAVNGFGQLQARQTGFASYTVLSWRNDELTAHRVNLIERTCTCHDYEYNLNSESEEICDHIAVALYSAPRNISVESQTVNNLSNIVSEARAVADELRIVKNREKAENGDSNTSQSTQTDESDDDGGSSGGDDGGVVDESPTPNDAQAELMNQLSGWIESAEEFNSAIDPEVVEVSWVNVNGREGAIVERVPWLPDDGRYFDDGEWTDKEAFDEARDAIGDLLSNQDAFEWYGEPDYAWFVPAEKVSEVV